MSRSFGHLLRSRTLVIGSLICLMVLLAGLLAPVLSDIDPMEIKPLRRLTAPSAPHYFGTDDMGRDVFSRVLHGTRLSLLIGVSVALVTMIVGTALGLIAGFSATADRIIMRLLDGMMAFPDILLAVALMAVFGASVLNVILALAVVYTPRTVRVVRSVVLVARENTYVEAARAIGSPNLRIMLKHLLPESMSPLTVQTTFVLAQAILTESSLSFLGVGVPPHIPSWGTILAGGRLLLNTAPWAILFPGIAIAIMVLGANMVGDGLRDVLDPRLTRK